MLKALLFIYVLPVTFLILNAIIWYKTGNAFNAFSTGLLTGTCVFLFFRV